MQISTYGYLLARITHLQQVACVLVWAAAWGSVEGKEDILETLFPDSIYISSPTLNRFLFH